MIWYGVQSSTVFHILQQGVALINRVLPDSEIFNFNPKNANFLEECARMSAEWSSIQMGKKGCNPSKGSDKRTIFHHVLCFFLNLCPFFFIGTLLAADGFVATKTSPTAKDLAESGLEQGAFRNRKSCWALICQAFCGKFITFFPFVFLLLLHYGLI